MLVGNKAVLSFAYAVAYVVVSPVGRVIVKVVLTVLLLLASAEVLPLWVLVVGGVPFVLLASPSGFVTYAFVTDVVHVVAYAGVCGGDVGVVGENVVVVAV